MQHVVLASVALSLAMNGHTVLMRSVLFSMSVKESDLLLGVAQFVLTGKGVGVTAQCSADLVALPGCQHWLFCKS